ncbi:MAG: hypothetical protein H0U49_08910 [Parachlamydiaceae bacterium]|nr:hypothetical protein [Parachlamydiaceae bacterium]
MNKRALLYLAITTSLLAFLLFAISISVPAQSDASKKRLDYNHVRGSAIEHAGHIYTLNFEQQNALINYINEAEAIDTATHSPAPAGNSKIIVYRFGAADILITSIGYIDDNLLFSAPDWNEGKPLLDKSEGQLKLLLGNAYDG